VSAPSFPRHSTHSHRFLEAEASLLQHEQLLSLRCSVKGSVSEGKASSKTKPKEPEELGTPDRSQVCLETQGLRVWGDSVLSVTARSAAPERGRPGWRAGRAQEGWCEGLMGKGRRGRVLQRRRALQQSCNPWKNAVAPELPFHLNCLHFLAFFFTILQNIMSAWGHVQKNLRAQSEGTQLVQSLSCINEDEFLAVQASALGRKDAANWDQLTQGDRRREVSGPHAPRQCFVHLPFQFYRRCSLFGKVTFLLHDDQSRQ